MQPNENQDQPNIQFQPGQTISPNQPPQTASSDPSASEASTSSTTYSSTQPPYEPPAAFLQSNQSTGPQNVLPQDGPEQPKQNSKKKLLGIGCLLLLLLVGLAVAAFLLMKNPKKHNSVSAYSPPLSATTGQNSPPSNSNSSSGTNSLRTGDAQGIATAAWQHLVQATPSSLPTSLFDDADNTLDICGSSTCTASTSPSGSAVLQFYKTSAVSIKSYTGPSMSVPDANTVYIVDNEACNSTDTGLGQITNSQIGKVFAVLYALNGPSGIQQQCYDSAQASKSAG